MTQQNAQSTSEPIISENDLIAQRHAKLKQIQDNAKQSGQSPWPNSFKREHYAADLQEQFKDQDKAQIEAAEHVYVKVACHAQSWIIYGDSGYDRSYPAVCGP